MKRTPDENYFAIRKIAKRLDADFRGSLDDATLIEAIKECCARELGIDGYNTRVVDRALTSVRRKAESEQQA